MLNFLKNNFKIFTILNIALALFIVNENDILAQMKLSDVILSSWEKCPYSGSDTVCGTNCKQCYFLVTSYGDIPVCGSIYGSGGDGSYFGEKFAFDYGLANGITSDAIFKLQTTNVFFFEDAVDIENPIGVGYIDAVVIYNFSYPHSNKKQHCYVLCEGTGIKNFDEWLELCGISNDYDIDKLSVSPNPTADETTLTMELLTDGNLNIILIDNLGQELLELHNGYENAGTFITSFTMSKFPVGAYFIKITHNKKVKMEKIIKN